MNKKRNLKNRLLSILLAVTMLAGSSGVWQLRQEANVAEATDVNAVTGYRELSFDSFSVDNGTYTTQQDRIYTELTSFDKVAFTGKFRFGQLGGSSPATDNVISLGGTANNKWNGIRIFLHSNGNLYVNNYLAGVTVVGNNPIALLTAAEVDGIASFVGQEIQIRMTFDYDATNVDSVQIQIRFEVNGQTIEKEARTLTGGEAALTRTDGFGMILKPNGSLNVKSVSMEETSDTTEQYKEVSFDTFGLEDETYTSQQDRVTTSLTNLNKVAFTGKFTFGQLGGSSPATDNVISLGGTATDKWKGIRIFLHSNGNLYVNSYLTGVTVEGNNPIALLTATEVDGIDSLAGQEIQIRITFDFDETDVEAVQVQVTFEINGQTIEKDVRTLSGGEAALTRTNGFGMLVKPNGNITIKSVQPVIEYRELSFNHFGVEDDTYTANLNREITWLKSFDKVAFTGNITFGQLGGTSPAADNVISLGGTINNKWTGIRIFLHSNGNLYVNNYLADVTVEGNNPICLLEASEVEGITSLVDEEIQVRLMFDFDATDVDAVQLQILFEVNGQKIEKNARTLIGGETALTRTDGFGILVAPNGSITVESVVKEVELEDIAYDIETKPYLVTSYHEATVTKDGVSVDVTDCVLDEAGDYEVQTSHSGAIAKQNVSLYVLGDVDLSEKTVTDDVMVALNEEDIAILKNIIAGTVSATIAQKKAADLNHDEEITNEDLKLLQDIVEGAVTRSAILKKYYPAAVSYSFLGSETEVSSEVMPIVGYRGPFGDNMTDANFKAIADTGINMINYLSNDNYTIPSAVLKELEYAQNNELGIFVTDSNLKPWSLDENSNVTSCTQVTDAEELSKLVGKYSYFDSYLGNFLVDEPVVDEEDTTTQGISYYKDLAKTLNGYTNMEGYINIAAGVWFDNGVSSALHSEEIASYEEDVKYIAEQTGVNVLSFDRYLTDTETVTNCPRYMLNLDIIRNQAKASDVPFWAYVPAGGGWADGTVPTKEELNWQLNMSLAFGAKGIQYYSLYTGADIDAGIMNENAATDWANIVTNANKQISAVDEILMKATNLGVYATGGYAWDNLTDIHYWDANNSCEATKSVDAYYELENLEADFGVRSVESIITSGEYGALAGVFDYQGKTALYIVNYDTEVARDIAIHFAGAKNYRVIDVENDVIGYGNTYTQTVQPGEAFLIVIEDEELDTTWQQYDEIPAETPKLDGYVFAGWYGYEATAVNSKTGYQEVSFTDFGAKDNTYTTTQTTANKKLSSFNHVAFTGNITFAQVGTTSSTVNCIALGGNTSSNSASWNNCFRIFLHSNGNLYVNSNLTNATVEGGGAICSLTAAEADLTSLIGAEIQIRMTFDYDATSTDAVQVQVTFEVNGQKIVKEARTITGGEAALTRTEGFGMIVAPNGSVTIRSVVMEDAAEPNVAITDLATYEGKLWAKFVDESVLTLKWQLATGTTKSQTDTTSIRLITTTDSLDYRNVGFKIITTTNKAGMHVKSKNVYSQIFADSGAFSYTPDMFDSHSMSFATLTLTDLPVIDADGVDHTSDKYTIIPFWTTMDGTVVYGSSRTITIAEGLN